MSPGTLLRLALAGTRTDTVRVLLTACAAALATLSVLATATVLAIRPAPSSPHDASAVVATPPTGSTGYAYQYTHNLLVEPGLRPGVAVALLLLCLPVLALAGQSAQLGAPARDRRLAQIRLAGATPRQSIAVAVTETTLAALLGTLLGTVLYFVGRALLHRPGPDGRLPLPTDQLSPAWTFLAVGAGLPLVAAAFAVLMLRRVAITPFGVVRSQRTGRPRPWPGLLIAIGLLSFVAIGPVTRVYQRAGQEMPDGVVLLLVGGGAFLAMLGVVTGTGWISYVTGRLLVAIARRPATLIAARRLMTDPWTGSRAFAALLAGTMVGAGAAGVRVYFTAFFGAQQDESRAAAAAQGQPYLPDDLEFYFSSLDLVDLAVTVGIGIAGLGLLVFIVEGLVSRRRAHSALVAAGVSRRTLAGATGWQMVAPTVPAIVLALGSGLALIRSISSEERAGGYQMEVCTASWEQCAGANSPFLRTVEIPVFTRPVAVPLAELAQVGGLALAAVAVAVGIAMLFLRASTDLTELRTA